MKLRPSSSAARSKKGKKVERVRKGFERALIVVELSAMKEFTYHCLRMFLLFFNSFT